jgi:hypothetical protein
VSRGGSHLSVGGETVTGKEASAAFFLLIGGGEREWSRSCTLVTVGRPFTVLEKPWRGIGSPAPCH